MKAINGGASPGLAVRNTPHTPMRNKSSWQSENATLASTTKTPWLSVFPAREVADAQRWSDFVRSHEECTSYHRWEWKRVIENTFGWHTLFLIAEEGNKVVGILPLVLQDSWLFGRWLSSVPIVQGGGVAAETHEASQALLEAAIRVTMQLRGRYLELRNTSGSGLGLLTRTDKVRAVLEIVPNTTVMWNGLDPKVRNLVRKGIKNGLSAVFGGAELIDEFYRIFARNMRDLGTPVYGKSLFGEVMNAFPQDSRICLVHHEGKTIAAAFLLGYRQTIESVWASSSRESLALSPNMFLYWSVITFASQHGYQVLDFGRSTAGSSTHRFKTQWGTRDIPLLWSYWLPSGSELPSMDRHNTRFHAAIRFWKQLPLGIANQVGPRVVRHLPS